MFSGIYQRLDHVIWRIIHLFERQDAMSQALDNLAAAIARLENRVQELQTRPVPEAGTPDSELEALISRVDGIAAAPAATPTEEVQPPVGGLEPATSS